jgi:hypothetical protein
MEEPMIINKKPEKVILPRPLAIEPPPRKRLIKRTITSDRPRLHIIFDVSGSMSEFDELYKRVASIVLGLLRKIDYVHSISIKDLKPDPELHVGFIRYKGSRIRSFNIIDNAPVKLYAFSRNAYEAIITEEGLATVEFISGGTSIIGALYLLLKNIAVSDAGFKPSILINPVPKGDVLILVTDFIFDLKEFEKLRETLRYLLATGLLSKVYVFEKAYSGNNPLADIEGVEVMSEFSRVEVKRPKRTTKVNPPKFVEEAYKYITKLK